ncbi:TDT family transporter [Streptomyces sp. NBC_00872]|uniref:SLAC1 family transporter n=1 Tax=Streptomyces sp. NBC_00872 TaxID=2903686 RepID=UPI0038680813|nr:TDT family transporter [Streptomyces sp. NBC_00872]
MATQAQRIPLNFFSMAFGLAGLAGCWVTAAKGGHVTHVVGDALLALCAVVWLATVVFYLRYVLSKRGAFRADLLDPVGSPFSSLAVITPMLLASQGLAPHAPSAGKVLVDIFLVLTVLLGGWLTGQWIYGPLELDRLHPGYFLPTVAGGLVAAASAAEVGQQRLAEAMLGLGIVCWFILGSMIMARLFFRPTLPTPLLPTLAIEVAPPTVASVAYFAVNGGRIDFFAAALAGYALLMVLAQIRLLPVFLRLRFTPSTWAFTFSWAAAVTATLHWNEAGRPAGQTVYTYLLLAAITAFIGAIAVRTALALARRTLLPPSP